MSMANSHQRSSNRTLVIRGIVLAIFTILSLGVVVSGFWMTSLWVKHPQSALSLGLASDQLFFEHSVGSLGSIRKTGGVAVSSVDLSSAADKAGIEPGDTIIAINGHELRKKPQAIYQALIRGKPGDKMFVRLIRKGQKMERTITLEDYERSITSQGWFGCSTLKLTQRVADSLHVPFVEGHVLTRVSPETSAADAGLKVGDILTRFNGREIRGDPRDFIRQLGATSPGTKVEIELRRGSGIMRVFAVMGRRPIKLTWSSWGSQIFSGPVRNIYWGMKLPDLIPALLSFLIGSFIGWIRLRERIAFELSLVFLCTSIASASMPFEAAWPSWLLVIYESSYSLSWVLAIPFLVTRVFSVFPQPSSLGRIILKCQWLIFAFWSMALLTNLSGVLTYLFQWHPTWFTTNPIFRFLNRSMDSWLYFYEAGMVLLLIAAQHIETRKRPQNRLRLIEMSLMLTALGLILYGTQDTFGRILARALGSASGYVTYYLPSLLVNVALIAFAYTIVRRKVFGIQFIIRRGLQHLMLSKGALAIEGGIIFLIVHQVLRYGGSAIASSATATSSLSVGSALLALVGLSRINRTMMPVIDRRFFRESCDIRHLLMDLGERLAELRARDRILRRTAATVMKALHPTRVMLLTRERDAPEIRCALLLENGRSRSISIEELERMESPCPSIELAPEDGVVRSLEGEKPWLEVDLESPGSGGIDDSGLLELGCELFIGVPGSSGLIGIIGLGPKLSEEPFSREDRELLMTVARQVGLALENAELLEVAKREGQMARELEIAREVQRNLLPKELPIAEGWDFAAHCRPARAVGGDYLDMFRIDEDTIAFALGDVSGKGLGPSLVMSNVHAMIRSGIRARDTHLGDFMEYLNEHVEASTSPEMFITLFVAVLDLHTGMIRCVNGGHNAPFLLRNLDAQPQTLKRGGMLVGAIPGMKYQETEIALEPGDLFLLYSDGVTEAVDPGGEFYGETRLADMIVNATKENAGAGPVLSAIFESVDRFAKGCEQSDDISLLLVKRVPDAPMKISDKK